MEVILILYKDDSLFPSAFKDGSFLSLLEGVVSVQATVPPPVAITEPILTEFRVISVVSVVSF